jgi:hypothetical protein
MGKGFLHTKIYIMEPAELTMSIVNRKLIRAKPEEEKSRNSNLNLLFLLQWLSMAAMMA